MINAVKLTYYTLYFLNKNRRISVIFFIIQQWKQLSSAFVPLRVATAIHHLWRLRPEATDSVILSTEMPQIEPQLVANATDCMTVLSEYFLYWVERNFTLLTKLAVLNCTTILPGNEDILSSKLLSITMVY